MGEEARVSKRASGVLEIASLEGLGSEGISSLNVVLAVSRASARAVLGDEVEG